MALNKYKIDKITGGLLIMILNTLIWVLIVEDRMRGKDYWLTGIIFSIVVLTFGYYYFKFNSLKKSLVQHSELENEAESKHSSKWFGIVYALEGIAIFIVVNILKMTNHSNYFIPSFALIVGLHFFPLGNIFKRKFDYYMGAWTCFIAITGIYLINQNYFSNDAVVTFVGIGCAISTSTYGIRMILEGKKQNKEVSI